MYTNLGSHIVGDLGSVSDGFILREIFPDSKGFLNKHV